MEYVVNMLWDEEAEVWVASGEGVGLSLESGSFDALMERVRFALPELLELNGQQAEGIELLFLCERHMRVSV